MPRKPLIRSPILPYHVFNRSPDQEFYKMPMKLLWPIACKYLDESSRRHNTEINAFVLMNNHYHLMVTTPFENLDIFMRDFQREVSLKISRFIGTCGPRIQARYKWELIESPEYATRLLAYIYRNPLRAGLCNYVEDYPWSAASFKEKDSNEALYLYPPRILQNLPKLGEGSFLDFLNSALD